MKMSAPEKEAHAILTTGVGEELADDIIRHRQGKKCPLTGRGAKALLKEYTLTGNAIMAAEEHLNMGWQGFKASWIKSPQQARQKPETPFAQHQREVRETLERSINGTQHHAQFDDNYTFDLERGNFSSH